MVSEVCVLGRSTVEVHLSSRVTQLGVNIYVKISGIETLKTASGIRWRGLCSLLAEFARLGADPARAHPLEAWTRRGGKASD
jgi:hypothetical protein